MTRNRREFLQDVTSGMLVAGLGTTLAGDLGISAAFANEEGNSLSFGDLHPLVELLQESPLDKLQPALVGKLQSGEADLGRLIAAAALANAETFGGEDYVGFHTEMALLPALQMADELPSETKPLPVLKVLYRNSQRIQDGGFSGTKKLKKVRPLEIPGGAEVGELLLEASRSGDMDQAEADLCNLRESLTRRGIQCPVVGHSGQRQRPPVRDCSSRVGID